VVAFPLDRVVVVKRDFSYLAPFLPDNAHDRHIDRGRPRAFIYPAFVPFLAAVLVLDIDKILFPVGDPAQAEEVPLTGPSGLSDLVVPLTGIHMQALGAVQPGDTGSGFAFGRMNQKEKGGKQYDNRYLHIHALLFITSSPAIIPAYTGRANR
jgi:hypothetical protein